MANLTNLKESRYPDASEIPQASMPDQGSPEEAAATGADHPVIKALKTIQMFVAAMKEKGDPNAEPMSQAFIQFLQSIQGQAGIPEQQAEEPQAEEQPQEPGRPMPMGSGNQMPMNANKNAKVLI